MTEQVTIHQGVVAAVLPEKIEVRIRQTSACASCHAKKFCISSDSSEKIIQAVPLDPVKVGDHVEITMQTSLGWAALFHMMIVPFCVLVAVFFSVSSITGNDIAAGFAGLAGMGVYYMVFYFFIRAKIERKFVFTAKKINNNRYEVKQ